MFLTYAGTPAGVRRPVSAHIPAYAYELHSPAYADELHNPAYAYELHSLVRRTPDRCRTPVRLTKY